MKRTLSWLGLVLGLTAACGVAPDGDGEGERLAAAKNGWGWIYPVLFVPNDRTVSVSQRAAIQTALGDVRLWYQQRAGTVRLRMASLRTCAGSHPSAWYLENQMSTALTEIETKLGLDPWADGTSLLVLGAGFNLYAGGRGRITGEVPGGKSGWAVIGLEPLFSSPECADYPFLCNPTTWRGTVIHEMGHGAFDLLHSEPPSIMDNHLDYTQKDLLDTVSWPEASVVRSSIFTTPVSSAYLENWSPCLAPDQCLSRHCGCPDVGLARVCLPDPGYEASCTAAPPAASCDHHSGNTYRKCGDCGWQFCLPSGTWSPQCDPAPFLYPCPAGKSCRTQGRCS